MNADANLESKLTRNLKTLRLPTIRDRYRHVAKEAEKNGLSLVRYLDLLTEEECDVRSDKRVRNLFRVSGLPFDKTFDTFAIDRLPPDKRRQIQSLTDGQFLDRKENVLLFGTPGAGKTHIIAALGHELVRKGHPVLFIPFRSLVEQLLVAQRELRLMKFLKKLARYEAIIIDDLGHLSSVPTAIYEKEHADMQIGRQDLEVIFALIEERYEKGSIMLTSNFRFGQWRDIFQNSITTHASIDRLIHHSVIITLNVPSFRLQHVKLNANIQNEVIESLEELPIPEHVEPNGHTNSSGLSGSVA